MALNYLYSKQFEFEYEAIFSIVKSCFAIETIFGTNLNALAYFIMNVMLSFRTINIYTQINCVVYNQFSGMNKIVGS